MVSKDWFIRNRTKLSIVLLLCLVRFFMNQSLNTFVIETVCNKQLKQTTKLKYRQYRSMTGKIGYLQSLSLSTCKRPYIVTKGFCKIHLKQTNDLYHLALNFLMDTQRDFFSKIPNFWSWADKFDRKSQLIIWNWDLNLNLGCKELGI